MVDEEKHPGAQCLNRRHGGSEALFGCSKPLDFVAVDGLDEIVTSREMAIESGVANTGSACDVVQTRRSAITGEGILGCLKDELAIALRVSAGFTCRQRWREFLFGHAKTFCNRGASPFI